MAVPPVIKPVVVDKMALPVEIAMPNGVKLYALAGGGNGILRLEFLFKGGYAIQEKPLQATFTNRMLREGAGNMSAEEISSKLDYYGAWIECYSSQNCNHIVLYCLRKHFVPLLELLRVVVQEPLFPQENLDVVRRNGKAHFEVNSKRVDNLAQRHFENALWGDAHPLAHIVEPSDYDNITRDDLVSYYKSVYTSRNLTLFLSGDYDDFTVDSIKSVLCYDEWGSDTVLNSAFVAPNNSLYGRRDIHLDGAVQSAVKIGFMAMEVSDPDFHKFRFLTVLLGGYFGSRLMSNVREENGYTYHISAEVDAYGRRNAFMISSETANEYVELCIKEIYHELQRLCDEPLDDAEVEHVRNYVLGEMCRECEGLTAKSEVFVNAWLSGESFASVNEYLEVVKNVTASELSMVAKSYFKPCNMIEIVVGGV